MPSQTYILGGGVTGLAAGIASGVPVLEAVESPGGICASYYVRPGAGARLSEAPQDGEAYRFEIGGGHWIFGGDPLILHFIQSLTPAQRYVRRSSVYFHKERRFVPFPLQNHLNCLPTGVAAQALTEMASSKGSFRTMKEWLAVNFGPTLCRLFFEPFHALYTAGLHDRIAPQDAYKSPVNLGEAIQGAFNQARPVGYNTTFLYPKGGLNALAQSMAQRCDTRYGKRVVRITLPDKILHFADGTQASFDALLSTLPLNRILEIANVEVEAKADPFTSVLVLNIGALRGENCPDDHWLYNFETKSGFHRVGFYSNVDRSFLPASAREKGDRVSIYVERAYCGGTTVSAAEIAAYADAAVRELQEWGFIGQSEAVDSTWIDVAYTWSWPNSRWKEQALQRLEEHKIYQIGRYGRWVFQGIADSIRDGFFAGQCFRRPSS